ncbi:MAG TPA: thiamine pyrophosphate-dependent enzyme, partial [Chitinophagales bacterium]|nr:thiamine pyrophosphate-dependent enzyme [Chitinophagales bacterium]
METFTYINNAHPAYIEALYQDFKENPGSVDTDWKKFFEGFDFAMATHNGNGHAAESTDALVATALDEGKLAFELKVWNAVEAYRAKGHLISDTNPVRKRKDRKAGLTLLELGFTEEDLSRETFVANRLGIKPATLKGVLDFLQRVYCGHIGAEYMYITNDEVRNWFQQKFESEAGTIDYPVDKKKHILAKLNSATVFEKFLHTKFIGQKRFSLEGGETTIAALDATINAAGDSGVEEIAIGMAHRGRLNVLANIIGKTYDQIFSEFEGNTPKDSTMGDGDVKYHLGYSSSVQTPAGNSVNLKLVANPSHLEAVDPVVEGFIRSKADMLYGSNYSKVLPILIHGDASVAGQGVVYEVLQMSQLKGYYTGGTIHFVINNQIGFTTDFDDARSAHYSTSVASMVHCPVLHVNGDDPEAVVYCMELAVEFRQKFNRDVFIDMVCYRRHGHNEGDDPKYTQPQLYELIGKKSNPREVYSNQLIEDGDIKAEIAQEMD